MDHYYYQNNHHRQQRFWRRYRHIVIPVIVIVVVVGMGLLVDTLVQHKKSETPSQATDQTTAVVGAEIQIFRSQFFQFQTDNSWKEIANETGGNKFVYRSFRGQLVEHELTIYVNTSPHPLEATHVLPAKINATGTLNPTSVSDHCRTNLPPNQQYVPQDMVFQKVAFHCKADSNVFSVLVGAIDGTASLHMKRPDGSPADYIILYTNLKAFPDGAQIRSIAGSFQTR